MHIYETTIRPPELIEQLTSIWENSVRETHKFLNETAIQTFKKNMPKILTEVPHLIVAEDSGNPIAFIGLTENEIDMLFVDSNLRGSGIGKKLIVYSIEYFQANQVSVNEQNPQAVGFYRHLGFKTYKRTETDGLGNPYPTLYMKLTSIV